MKRLIAFDLDGTLLNTPESEDGKRVWSEAKGELYSMKGWWSKPESLDTTVFDIKPFPEVLAQLNKEKSIPDTVVIILTSRVERLRPQVENILKINNIIVDDVLLKEGNEDKGDIILKIAIYNPDLEEIVVYDDFMDKNEAKINEYTKIKDQLSPDIKYTLYYVDNGRISLLESINMILGIINEEIQKFVVDDNYVYHGTYDGAGYFIQRTGKMKINAANNNEPFISFTSKPNVAKYYANMKGGSARGIILRTKKTSDFIKSPKYKKNNGYEWITSREIPAEELEISTKYGWIPLNSWDFVDKEIKK